MIHKHNPLTNSVLLVDDHPVLRKGLKELIKLEEDLTVVGECGSGEAAVAEAVHTKPDLILLDVNMKGISGIETLKSLRSAGVKSRIVVFSVSDDREDVVAAFKAGADGYLLKDMEPEELILYIRRACEGKMVLSEELTQMLATAFREDNRTREVSVNTLTRREKQILSRVAAGQRNKIIAHELNITEATVKVHIKHILRKLKVSSRVEAAVWVAKNNIKIKTK